MGSGRSRPISARTAAMSCGDASGPATSRAGSPGNRCTKRNTRIVTANKTGMVHASRRIRYSNTRSLQVSVLGQMELLIGAHGSARQVLRVCGKVVLHGEEGP